MLGCIGMGGMGQVYAAYDPQLDRKVALKVLHEERDRRDDPRLIREAQGLARLTHPNVVTVHEVGSHQGRLFVAMEFVEGVTLREWTRRRPVGSDRRLAAVLDYLVQAGQGLAAAHRAGLVHRDFKPGNVLIGDDGRVRVVDFGLVRVVSKSKAKTRKACLDAAHGAPPVDEELLALLDDRPLTRPGSLVGTPAYMAPEQFLMTEVNAATDQFAFCVTAWEAIFGVRPFAGKTIPAVLEAIRKQHLARSPQGRCPEAIEAALRKGLVFGPRRRHKTMAALLEALKEARSNLRESMLVQAPSRHRLWLGTLVLAGTTVTTGFALGRDKSPLCSGADQHLAGIWDDETEARLEQAFVSTGARFARDAWTHFDRELDRYAQRWVAGHRDACEAAQIRKEQSAALMDLRMACLHDRRRELTALTELYARPDVEMLAHTDKALSGLEPIDVCADIDHVRHRGALMQDSEDAARGHAVLQRVAQSAVLERTGRYAESAAMAEKAVAEATALGQPSVTAQAFLQRGKVHMRLRQGERASDDLEQAHILATQADMASVAFESSHALIQVNGVLLMRFGEGRLWARIGRSEAQNVDDEPRSRFHIALGTLHRVAGRFVEAERSYEQAVELLDRSVGTGHLAYAAAIEALGALRMVTGGSGEALPLLREAVRLAEQNLGAHHPSMARFHASLAEGYRLHGDLDLAVEHANFAVELAESAFGPDHVALYPTLDGLASVLEDRGEVEAALATLERARSLDRPEKPGDAILARLFAREGEIRFQRHDYRGSELAFRRATELSIDALGDAHPHIARYRIGLGAALGAQGRRDEGIALIEAGRAIGEATLGSQHPNVAVSHDALASEMERIGDFESALGHTERVLAIYEASYGEDGFQLMKPHGNMCSILGQLGRTVQAVEHCRKALELAEAAVSSDESLLAKLHNNLGAALVAARRWDEAQVHYQKARDIWQEQLGPQHLMVGIVLANLAEIHQKRGQLRQAEQLYEQSLAIREEQLGATHPIVVVPLVGLANLMTTRGRTVRAIELARRAVAVAQSDANPLSLARARETLGHALWSQPGSRAEAVALVKQVRQSFERVGTTNDRNRLNAWWPAHSATPK